MSGADYVPFWCKSNYSFLEGASHPDELVEEARSLGLRALALTDRDGVYGVVRAHVKARELGLKLIVGAQMTLEDASQIVLIASSREGYANLCELITVGRRRSEKGSSRVRWIEVCERSRDLFGLWGGDGSLLVGEPEPDLVAERLKSAFGERLYAMIVRHRRAEEVAIERRVRQRARRYGISTIAAHEVLYHHKGRRPLQDVLCCVREKVTLSLAGRRIKPNDEHELKAPFTFQSLFADDPLSVARTLELAEACQFSLDQLHYRYPSERLPDGSTSAQWLRRLTFEGALERYPEGIPDDVVRQLDKELALIEELDYCGYFLTMYEIVSFCRAERILCQGRGSAANSAVCYCLGLTAVDPVRMGLLFERFLSRERAEPPDIDLDIEHERREEVIQFVYEKYGRTHAAMVANVIRYRPRSAVRDVGKVLGIPETAVDRVARLLNRYDAVDAEVLEQGGLGREHAAHQHLLRLSNEVLDFPRHLSIHPGGFLLGHEPVSRIVPIENATMAGRTVIQWDKDDLEELNLFKVDLLGLGALTMLHRIFDLLKAQRSIRLAMATLPANDEPTYEMIRRGDTVGVFQIESRAQMAMLPRLKPRNFYDLVIEISIVRPGPITGGMVHPYLRRRAGLEAVDYPHPSLQPVLQKTLGIPLFQEQVMRLAVVAADYTPGEADQLRRDMAAWRRSGRLERHRERLISRMEEKGIAHEFAERVFEQIRGFGEYGFPESHAASFALIAYATAYLRCHYPAEFVCGLLNSQPMGFYSPATIIGDGARHGVEIRPIDVTRSEWDCTLERPLERPGERARERTRDDEPAVRMGMRYLKGFAPTQFGAIRAARETAPFASLDDFVRRSGLDRRTQTKLARSGALVAFDGERRSALWQVQGFVARQRDEIPLEQVEARVPFVELSELEQILWDLDTSWHSTRGHPLAPLRETLKARGWPDARSLNRMAHGKPVKYAGIVICRQRPGTAAGVTFMTLEDETGFVNLVVWQQVFERYAILARTSSFLGVSGKLQVEQGVVHLIADELWAPDIAVETRTQSRDFH